MSTFEEQIDPANSLHPDNVAHNARTLNYIRSTVASISGAVAGILGLTSFYGFGFYLFGSLFAAVVIYICNVGLSPRKYFKNGFVETATQGLLGNMMSFTLFWTMFYGLVHIFEA